MVKQELLNKISSKTAKIGVVGIGYVGLPLAVEKGKVGYSVTGFDRSEPRVDQINRGENYIKDVRDEELADLVKSGKVSATTDFDRLIDMDVIIVCVPTPLTQNLDPDISYIINVTNLIAKTLKTGQLVSLESTTYPGTTQEVMLPILAKAGLKVGQDYFLAFSPERVDPGNARYTTKNTNKLVGGVTPACLEVASTLYKQTILNVVSVSSPAVAEMAKVFENTFRAINIALVNEMALLCDKMGLNVWEVVEAAGTKPFGIMTFYPGPGVGGHCIPIDPFYLTWKAREYDFHTRFIELAGEINTQMHFFVREKVVRALSEVGKGLKNANILILGVAYKKDIEDFRESPALKVISLLSKDNCNISYYDPFVPSFSEHHGNVQLDMTGIKELKDSDLSGADCVLILTDHSSIDYARVVEKARIVVDTRNATKNVKDRSKIILL